MGKGKNHNRKALELSIEFGQLDEEKLIEEALRAAYKKAYAKELELQELVAPASDLKFGDYQSNLGFRLARELKCSPPTIAEHLKRHLELEGIESKVINGYLNFKLSPEYLETKLNRLLKDPRLGVAYADPKRTVIDYSAPNVAKEMHVGHLRSTIIGDTLARIMEFRGHSVTRQNHLGDFGTQFGMLVEYLETKGINPPDSLKEMSKLYQASRELFKNHPEFKERALQRVRLLQQGEERTTQLWKQLVESSVAEMEEIYKRLDVTLRPEDLKAESAYQPYLEKTVRELQELGVAEDSEGAKAIFIEGYSDREGRPSPLLVEKTGGGYMYGTTDLAALKYRIRELKAQRIIYVTGLPQERHFEMVFKAGEKAGWTSNTQIEHAGFGSVLGPDKKPFKTREGEVVPLSHLIDQAEKAAYDLVKAKNPDFDEAETRQIAHAVGVGAIKYADLSNSRQKDYVFDIDKMVSLEGNTAPYLQYAEVRARSILKKASEKPGPIKLQEAAELELSKKLIKFPKLVESVEKDLEPHQLCSYLYELARAYSSFYEHCPVIKADPKTQASRLSLCKLTSRTLSKGLELLGIRSLERM